MGFGPLAVMTLLAALPCGATPLTPASGTKLLEAHAAGMGAQAWALFFNRPHSSIRANTPEKIVWRMTGSGDFNVVAIDIDGNRLAPSQSPMPNSGSSWNRPGDEWGTAWVFHTPAVGICT